MPRDGSGIYSIPPGTQGSPNTTIESAKYNAYIADVEVDLNAPRPVVAGGTGGNSPAAARDNIDAERAMQVVTNYDSMVWEAGSFFSAIGATSAPVAGHAFAGIVYGSDQNNLVLEARDLSDTNTPGLLYVREKAAGVWGAWFADVDLTIVNSKVAKAGDTMTGNLLIQKSGPMLNLSKAAAAEYCSLTGALGAALRWSIELGNNAAESGANVGSNFGVSRYTDPGALIDSPLTIDRATGIVTANGLLNYSPQTLTAAQQVQARANVYAAPFDALAYNGMQVNGSMEIDQFFAGTAITAVGYLIDGVAMYYAGTMGITAQQVTDAPPGYVNSVKLTVTAAQAALGAQDYAFFRIPIEGRRVSRLAFGKAAAQSVSVGFWVKMHRAGLYSASVTNAATTRSFPVGFMVNAADTWEFKAIAIPGDLTGTWPTDNGVGLLLYISMALGSSYLIGQGSWQTPLSLGVPGMINGVAAVGDTFQVTGLIIVPGTELPSAARAPFIMRPFGEELRLCQRYFELAYPEFRVFTTGTGQIYECFTSYLAQKRTGATLALRQGGTSSGNFSNLTLQDFGSVGYRILAISSTASEMYYNSFIYNVDARF